MEVLNNFTAIKDPTETRSHSQQGLKKKKGLFKKRLFIEELAGLKEPTGNTEPPIN